MIARRCDYKNEQAFLSALPLLALDPDVERKSRRNALTSGVAAAFPFASYELSDRNGVFLGLNLYNRSPVFLDPYDDYKYTNGNCWIGGSSGAGKTFTLQCLGGRLRQQGRRVIFIVPKKGHEFRPLCELLGGLYLRMSPSSRDCPNIMAIRRRSLDSYAGLRDMAARDDSVLADKISRLIIWYSLQKRDLSDEDKNYLDSSLVECYRQYGITFDNATITDENGDFVEMPIIADWYKVLADNPETKHLSVVLARYVTGSASAMGARNDIDLDNKYIVLDTSGMPDDLLLPGIFWATDIANDLIMDSREDLSALIADELWSLVGANSNPLAAGFVQEMVKTIRGLGGIAVTSTQGIHYVCPGIGKLALIDELAAFNNQTAQLQKGRRTFVFTGESYSDILAELEVSDTTADSKLISYGDAYRNLQLPVHLLSCDDTGAVQLQIMSIPDYRQRLTKAALKSQYQPPDNPAWDALFQGIPFVMAADMDLRRLDAALSIARQEGYQQIAVAALEGQAETILFPRYRDTGKARVFILTSEAITEVTGKPPVPYTPPRTQFLTAEGDVIDAPPFKAPGRTGRQTGSKVRSLV